MCRMHGATRHQATRFSVVPHSSLSVRQRPLPLCTMRTTYYKNRWTSAHQRNLRLPAVALSTFRGEAHVRESTSHSPDAGLLPKADDEPTFLLAISLIRSSRCAIARSPIRPPLPWRARGGMLTDQPPKHTRQRVRRGHVPILRRLPATKLS